MTISRLLSRWLTVNSGLIAAIDGFVYRVCSAGSLCRNICQTLLLDDRPYRRQTLRDRTEIFYLVRVTPRGLDRLFVENIATGSAPCPTPPGIS
jgi:hypothetical protein